MRELPEPDGEFYSWASKYRVQSKNGWSKESVLAIQRQAYEDGLRYADTSYFSVLPMDKFEQAIRDVGIVSACEWFGHAPDSEFTLDTIKVLAEREAALKA